METESLQNTKRHGMALALLLTLVVFNIPSVIYSLAGDSLRIPSTGKISLANILARSGTANDIQAAVDIAATHDIGSVRIPEGIFAFTTSNMEYDKRAPDGTLAAVLIPGGVNVFGAGADKTVLRQPTDPLTGSAMFCIDGANGKPTRISGIRFDGYVGTESFSNKAIRVLRAKDFRIDHNYFEDFSSSSIHAKDMIGYIHRGVIDHNVFDNPYKDVLASQNPVWGYGIQVNGDGTSWEPIDSLLGQFNDNVVYIEDNVFTRCRYAIASNTGGYYVFRYNNVSKPRPIYYAGVDVHEGATDYFGGRGLEAYHNLILQGEATHVMEGFKLRGGSGVIYDNDIQDVAVGVWLLKAEWATDTKHYVTDLYIWGNKMTNVGTPISAYPFYEEGVHYFLTEKSYTPYPYPHPLVVTATP